MLELSRKKREWRHGLTVLTAALCLAAGSAAAEAPLAKCRAVLAGDRALVDIELTRFVDARLAKLIRLGLAGRIQLELVLLKKRPFWFDDQVERAQRESSLRFAPEDRTYVLDGESALDDPLRLSLQRISLRAQDGLEGGATYRVEVKASLRVVTPQSLGKVAAWLAGQRDESGSDVSQTLLQAVAEDLVRSASCSCEAERLTANPPAK